METQKEEQLYKEERENRERDKLMCKDESTKKK